MSDALASVARTAWQCVLAVKAAVEHGYLGAADAHLDADDADESGSASCAAEGTGGLVVDVTAPADDEGLHEEEGSRDE